MNLLTDIDDYPHCDISDLLDKPHTLYRVRIKRQLIRVGVSYRPNWKTEELETLLYQTGLACPVSLN